MGKFNSQLKQGSDADVANWPATVKNALTGLQTAAKTPAFRAVVADLQWARRRAALAERGITLPDWSKPSVLATPEGQAARKAAFMARLPAKDAKTPPSWSPLTSSRRPPPPTSGTSPIRPPARTA